MIQGGGRRWNGADGEAFGDLHGPESAVGSALLVRGITPPTPHPDPPALDQLIQSPVPGCEVFQVLLMGWENWDPRMEGGRLAGK